MEFSEILYTKEDGVALITLNRPQLLNAMSERMHQEWREAVEDAKRDDSVKVVVVTGAGRAFCAGANPRVLNVQRREPVSLAEKKLSLHHRGHDVARSLATLDKPYIGAINGPAAGGGMDVASMCDIRIASDQARFVMAYVRMGMIPADGGSYFLPRIVDVSRACELIWTGRALDAYEALRLGYVSKVVPHDELMPYTLNLARQLARGPAVAIRLSKSLIYRCLRLSLERALEASEEAMLIAQNSEDAQEGVRAWAERREPNFQGR